MSDPKDNEVNRKQDEELEQASSTEEQDAEFDSVWGEATGSAPPSDEPTDEPKPNEGEDEQEDDDDAPLPEHGDDAATDEPEGESTREEPKADAEEDQGAQESEDEQDDLAARIKAEEERLERLKQETRTWQGRTKKAREQALEAGYREDEGEPESDSKVQDAMNRVADAQREAGREGQAVTDEDMANAGLSDEERELLKEAEQEYPEHLLKAMRAMAKEEANRMTEGARREARLTREEMRRQAQERHVNAIRDAHPDFEQHVSDGSLDTWIKSLPYEDASEYLRIKQKGTAPEVIGMLDAFKQSQRASQRRQTTQTRRDKQFESGAAGVRRRSGGPPAGKPDNDDFDGAWDEATN